jgi:hypothetical protein
MKDRTVKGLLILNLLVLAAILVPVGHSASARNTSRTDQTNRIDFTRSTQGSLMNCDEQ